MNRINWTRASCLVALGILAACSANTGNDGIGNTNPPDPARQSDASDEASNEKPSTPAPEGGLPNWDANAVNDPDAKGVSSCNTDPDEDFDGDGYSVNQGDCNDCDPLVNPGAFDVVGGVDGGAGVDEDCDGVVDNEPTDCDVLFNIDDPDPMNAAHSIGLCRTADLNAQGNEKTWGVISAAYVKADGKSGMNDLSHGLLPRFGAAVVQEGKTMLALSSGTARAPNHTGYQSPSGANMNTTGNPPPGYPKESPSCPGVKTGACNDPAALELQIRVPTNAQSFTFDFNFYTYEYPDFICSTYNDFFVTMMDPKPPNLPDGNISFDQDGNPVSVNNSLLQVCKSGKPKGKDFPCPLGTDLLQGTGFEEGGGHAATGWLQTKAPVEPGSVITLRFAIWDSGDHVLDSTVLIDNFQWSVEAATETVTEPIPIPK